MAAFQATTVLFHFLKTRIRYQLCFFVKSFKQIPAVQCFHITNIVLHAIPMLSQQAILQSVNVCDLVDHTIGIADAFEEYQNFAVFICQAFVDLHLRFQCKEEV